MFNISGKFSRVSKTTYREGVVLVGFCGNVWPRDLSKAQIEYIKTYYNMIGCYHEFFNEWPGQIEPAYDAAKSNFINGFMLLQKEV